MPVTGRKLKAEGERRNRMAPTHDWIEVQNVAFEGGPHLPRIMATGLLWPPATRKWWSVISRMPHCVLWDEADWQFAGDTAILVAGFHSGDLKLATEIRQREKIMGTTLDARRDLRIRYVEALPEEEALGVAAIDDYKKRLGGR